MTEDSPRIFEASHDPVFNHLPVAADTLIFAGAAVGATGSGYHRPLVAGDAFGGFAIQRRDNRGGADGDQDVKVRPEGAVKLNVVGVSGPDDVGAVVYASDDNTFTLTQDVNTPIGKVLRHISGPTCMVYVQAAYLQSL